jgi:hypothetical protein
MVCFGQRCSREETSAQSKLITGNCRSDAVDDRRLVRTSAKPPARNHPRRDHRPHVLPPAGLLLEDKIDAGLQSIPWVYIGEDAGLNNLGAANDYVGEWQFTTYNVNSDWAKANPAKTEGFLRVLLRATEWTYRDKPMSAEIAAREMNIKTSHQIKAGLLPASRTFNMSNMSSHVVSDYLERARATVPKD